MLIVSIQGYTMHTTQELSNKVIEAGAHGIRTDKPIVADFIIGLKKDLDKKYYITTSKKDILAVSKWTNNIAIDSRKGNQEIEYLYSLCHVNEIDIVADIETIKDFINILKLCNQHKFNKPKYIATTFSKCNRKLIHQIKTIDNSAQIIAEGGYNSIDKIKEAYDNGASYICIGAAISDIGALTRKFLTVK